jgi:hypothetical protein
MGLQGAYFVPSTVDPLGLWTKIVRSKKELWANTCSDKSSDTWASLAAWAKQQDGVALNPAEYQKWVSHLDGSNVGPTPVVGKTYRIPNTYLFVWMGELGWLGRWALSWGSKKQEVAAEGFHIVEIQLDSDDWWFDFLANLSVNTIDLSKKKALHGWVSVSHGFADRRGIDHGMSFTKFSYKPGAKFREIYYKEIGAWMDYGLADAEVHACWSSQGKPHFLKGNPNGRFVGYDLYFDPRDHSILKPKKEPEPEPMKERR